MVIMYARGARSGLECLRDFGVLRPESMLADELVPFYRKQIVAEKD